MTRRTTSYMRLIFACAAVLMIVAWCLALMGCHGIKPVLDPTPRLTAPLSVVKSEAAAASTDHAAARKDLATADKLTAKQPDANAAVRSADQHVAAAETHVVTAGRQADAAIVVAVDVGKQSVADQTAGNEWKAKYDAVNSMWIAPRMKRWAWALGILWLASFVLTGALKLPAAGSPAIAAVLWFAKVIRTFGGKALEDAVHLLHAAYDRWHATPGTPKPAVT